MLLPLHRQPDDEYRVPKSEVAVQVKLRGRASEPVSVFLADSAASHSGFERPSDVLLAAEPFVPVKDEHGRVELLRKDAISWMSATADAEAHGRSTADVHPSRERCRRVEVHFEDGHSLDGEVVVCASGPERRVQDFLNAPGQFFELRRDGRFVFVNRGHVLMIKTME